MIMIPFKDFVIGRLSMTDCHEEIAVLDNAHYVETETKYKSHTVKVNYPHFIACEKAGTLHCFGVRLAESTQLVAHLRVYVSPSAHDSSLVATEDAYYIVPEYRGSGLARRLLQYSKKRLKELGVDYFFMSSKHPVGGPNIGLFLETEDFKPITTVYMAAL